ncbi:MAG: 3'-5' exonuclease [Planctomycetaceae bacterium]
MTNGCHNHTGRSQTRFSRQRTARSRRLVFVDLETAGQQPWRPIMQIGAVAVEGNGRTIASFEAKVQFREASATKRSLLKRHYDRQTWSKESRPSYEVALAFRQFLLQHSQPTGCTSSGQRIWLARLVAHNAAFDGPFLRLWFERYQMPLPADYRILCSLQRALWFFQEHPEMPAPTDLKLATLCRYFGIRYHPNEAHDALVDAKATAELYRRLSSHR